MCSYNYSTPCFEDAALLFWCPPSCFPFFFFDFFDLPVVVDDDDVLLTPPVVVAGLLVVDDVESLLCCCCSPVIPARVAFSLMLLARFNVSASLLSTSTRRIKEYASLNIPSQLGLSSRSSETRMLNQYQHFFTSFEHP